MTELSWAATKRLVHERAQGCCEYCQTCEQNTAQPMHIDHIDPDGGDAPDNLCLACSSCNLIKGVTTSALDLITNEVVRLFNPRLDSWSEHFQWVNDATMLYGKTPIARATITRLKMNQKLVRRARANWHRANTHPPSFA